MAERKCVEQVKTDRWNNEEAAVVVCEPDPASYIAPQNN
jgi:hypothetical protein